MFQNFLDAKVGDMVIGYESNPVKQIVAIKSFWQTAVLAGRLPNGRYTCPVVLKRFGLVCDDHLTNAGEVLFGSTHFNMGSIEVKLCHRSKSKLNRGTGSFLI